MPLFFDLFRPLFRRALLSENDKFSGDVVCDDDNHRKSDLYHPVVDFKQIDADPEAAVFDDAREDTCRKKGAEFAGEVCEGKAFRFKDEELVGNKSKNYRRKPRGDV